MTAGSWPRELNREVPFLGLSNIVFLELNCWYQNRSMSRLWHVPIAEKILLNGKAALV